MTTPLGLQVRYTGWDWKHPADWWMLRPDGAGEWVFIVTLSPARWSDGSREQLLAPGTCLLYPPTGYQSYGAAGKPFANHWFHATGPALADLAKACSIPVATPITQGDPTPVAQAMARLHQEFTRREPAWEAASAAALVAVLVAAGRAHRDSDPLRHRDDRALYALRERLQQHPTEPWPVARMARLAGLSPSRFSARYRSAFATSPNADVIAARLTLARRLLEGGATVEQAAEQAGFADVSYFHRQFRRRLGCTPATCRGHP